MIYYNRLSDNTWFIHRRIELFRFILVNSEASIVQLVLNMNGCASFPFLKFVEVSCEFTAEDLSSLIDSVYLSGLSRQLEWKLSLLLRPERLKVYSYNPKISLGESLGTDNSEVDIVMGSHMELKTKVRGLIRWDIFVGKGRSSVAVFIICQILEYHLLICSLTHKTMVLRIEAIEYLWQLLIPLYQLNAQYCIGFDWGVRLDC